VLLVSDGDLMHPCDRLTMQTRELSNVLFTIKFLQSNLNNSLRSAFQASIRIRLPVTYYPRYYRYMQQKAKKERLYF